MENPAKYVLMLSITYIVTGAFGIWGGAIAELESNLPGISLMIMALSWITMLIFVHLDIKATGRNQYWSLVPFLFGGFGGLVYYFTSKKESQVM